MISEDFNSGDYWQHRYQKGRDSGAGSYGRLAEYKANFLNEFISANNISSVIEFGCGDGAQLDLARYPQYIGVDIAPTAIEICQQSFEDDYTKCFASYALLPGLPAQEASLSLDVIFHLVEDSIFEKYMRDLFSWATRYVIIYSSNRDENPLSPHVRHRRFTQWIDKNIADWKLHKHASNPYPEEEERPGDTSFADFYIYARVTKI